MALVAYDYSDSSDIEEDENATVVTLNNKTLSVPEPQKKEEDIENNQVEAPLEFSQANTSQSLFNKLPEPSKKKQAVIEEDDEFLHKKETQRSGVKPKAKITVPSLHDFKDVKGTIPSTKPKVANGKKSGLLSMLPQPRNAALTSITTKSFVPHVLTQKPATTVKKKEILPSPAKVKQEVNTLAKAYLDDSDEDEEIQNDFFSINKTEEIPIDVMPDVDIKPNTSKATSVPRSKEEILQSYFKPEEPCELPTDLGEPSVQYESTHTFASKYGKRSEVESSNANNVLDEEAIRQLCGARGKQRREEIQIVDVNQQEVLADAREWLLKGLMDDTTKRVSSSKRRGDEPTSQQKRKHQITYLAHQAKANEAELQNQWANNRMSKRQTQSKYGF